MKKSLFFLTAIFLAQGCTTVASMRSRSSDGLIQTYDADYKNAFEAARLACGAVGLSVEEENFDQKYIIARSSGRTNGLFVNYGELVGIYFSPFSDDTVSISITTKRIYKPGFLYYETWDEEIHSVIDSYLADLKWHA